MMVHHRRRSPALTSLRLAMPLLACLLVACSAPAPRVQSFAPVQAFVSAALLTHWCRSQQPVDVEACLSYLRGGFDTATALATEHEVNTGYCIPADAAVTELRQQVRDRPSQGDADTRLAAARMLGALWRERYPCVPASD